jgi:hypothetical protein
VAEGGEAVKRNKEQTPKYKKKLVAISSHEEV